MDIAENVRKIRKELDRVNKATRIVAATKTRNYEAVKACMDTGLVLAAGENRVQELMEKYTEEFRWDFIGRLQTNKVKYIVGKVELIHSLDREELAEAVQKECSKHNFRQKMLIEINTGEEESKGGIKIDELDNFLDSVAKYDKIEINGLMAVVPIYYTEEMLRKTYERVYEAYFKRKSGIFKELSMGMSGDYLIAAESGATIVRPGTAIFGERSYK